jgi:serine/threonine-protein kinase
VAPAAPTKTAPSAKPLKAAPPKPALPASKAANPGLGPPPPKPARPLPPSARKQAAPAPELARLADGLVVEVEEAAAAPSEPTPTPARTAERERDDALAVPEERVAEPGAAEVAVSEFAVAEVAVAEADVAEVPVAVEAAAEAAAAEGPVAVAEEAVADAAVAEVAAPPALSSTEAPAAATSAPALPAPPKEGAAARARRAEHDTQELLVRSALALPPDDALEPLAPFGRFQLLGRVATGGMAEILLARESTEGAGSRHVIVKVIRGELAEEGEFAKMFLNEGRLAMRLSHPNICTVYECGRHDGRFFMAMEYVHGQTLREVLLRCAERDEKLPIPVILRVFALMAEALEFAHRATDAQGRPLSIVHRDVTPHNIMIRYDGVVKLLDFGVAKAERSQHSTESGALKGKFSYMAPEHAMGTGLDARADIFSLGVCLYEAVTGRRLFHRKTQYDTLKAILESEPPPLSAFRDDVPDRLEDIVLRALAKDADTRYPTAGALQHDLEQLLAEMREVASTSRIRGVMQRLFADEASQWPKLERGDLRERYLPAPASVTPVAAPRTPSRLPMMAAASFVLLLLVAGGGWYALSSGGEETDTASAAGTIRSAAPMGEPARTEPPRELAAPPPSAAIERAPEPAAPPVAVTEPPTLPTPTPENEPNAPAERATDGTLASSSPVTSARPGPRTTPRRPAEGASRPSSSPASTTSGSRRGPVIVTDPGF